MNIENRMVVGDYYQDEQEKRPDEVNDLFASWLEKADEDTDYFERFLEAWHPAELLSFMLNNRMNIEFKKFKAQAMASDFTNETGEQINQDYVRRHAA